MSANLVVRGCNFSLNSMFDDVAVTFLQGYPYSGILEQDTLDLTAAYRSCK